MLITTTKISQHRAQLKAPPAGAPGPRDTFTFGETDATQGAGRALKALIGAALGAGVGVAAGLNTGTLATVGGAAVAALPAAFGGAVSGALIGEKLGGQGDSSRIVGAGLWGAVLGGAAGAAGGAYIASNFAGWPAAVALGIGGGITGLLVAGS